MVRVSIGSALCLLASATWVSGLRLPIQRKRAISSQYGSFSSSWKSKVGSILTTDANGSNSSDVGNVNDIRYTTTVNINGVDVLVALDTGSTDLWVIPPNGLGDFNDTGIPVSLLYGDGSYGAQGTVGIAPFKWGPYEVPHQAFMNAVKSTIGSLTDIGIYGLFGLGFNDPAASVINANVQAAYGPDATWGNSVLTNIFTQNTSTPNFIAIDLARSEDYEEIDGGAFTIGEYDPEYAAVANSPKVPVFPDDSTRWSILLEDITVNGKSVSLDGYANAKGGAPNGKLNALLDTGAPTVGLPKEIIAAIYGAIDGSAYDEVLDIWLVPCKATVDLEVTFGGQKYPIHALDLTIPQWATVGDQNYTTCTSTFSTFDANTEFDVLFGDPFLRNTYTVYDFGDFTDNTGNATGKAYIQLLAETDATKVAQEVLDARTKTLSTLSPEIAPTDLIKLLNAQSDSNSNSNSNKALNADSSDSSLLDGKFGGVEKYVWVIIGLLSANVLLVTLVLAVGVYMCVSRRGKRGSNVNIYGGGPQKYEPVKLDGY